MSKQPIGSSNLIVLNRDNAANNLFYPPAADAVVLQAIYYFDANRKPLGPVITTDAFYQAPNSGYTAIIILTTDNAAENGFNPPASDANVATVITYFGADRNELGPAITLFDSTNVPQGSKYQAPTSGYTAIPNFVDAAKATGSPITLIPKNFII